MNERIEKLFEQALEEFKAENKYATIIVPNPLKENFAELIVRECMKVVIDGQYSDTECEGNSHRISYNNGSYGASSDIKKHFGVEE